MELYGIVDPAHLLAGRDLLTTARQIVDGGVSYLQLRVKDRDGRSTYEMARQLVSLCRDAGVPFIVNDRLDIALAAGADGVHLGPGDLPVEAARKVVGPEFLIGGSAASVEVARRLQQEGADYLGVGAIFEARSTKRDASAPRGPQIIEEVVAAVDLPVFGIGGITPENASEVIARGATGVAVITALTRAADPAVAAQKFLASGG